MNHRHSPTPPTHRPASRWIGVATLAAAGLLAACGGVIDDGEGFLLPSLPAAAASSAWAHDEPADHAARTRAGLYLSRSAAEATDRALGGQVVWVDVGCCAGDSADQAVLVAYGVQAAANLPNDVPFLVTGGDLRLAALITDRLLAEGHSRPYLVTP